MRAGTRHYWLGVWRFADPKITLASMASMTLGVGCAWHDGVIAWAWVGLAVLGMFCLEAAKNASGEVVDWDSGADQRVEEVDRSPFSGGKRVLVDGLMTRREVWVVALVAYALGCAAGLVIVTWHAPQVLWLGVAGVAVAFFYHAPPFKLSYRGLGELAVGAAYGPGICLGTYWVAHGGTGAWPALAAVPLGVLIAAFLWINEFPDRRADAASGKRTLVVRLGARTASRVFAVIVVAGYALAVALACTLLPWGLLGGLLGLPLGWKAVHRLWRQHAVTVDVIPAQAWTLFGFVLHAVGAAVGLAVMG